MQDTPIFDTFMEDLKSSVDGKKIEDCLTQTLIQWVSDTLEQSFLSVSVDDGQLWVSVLTPDDVDVKRPFEEAVGVGAWTQGDDRKVARELASALRIVAEKLELDAGQ